MTRYHAQYAWLGGPEPARDVLIETDGGRIVSVTPGQPGAAPPVVRLPGLTLPGLANAHSHAFHRALRGRDTSGPGTFWTWRDGMYALAQRLDPDTYHRLARATFAEMVLAGITVVGEFHYLHHAPGGTRYADPNAMGHALLAAAREAGIRITLLDTLYLTSTVDGDTLRGPQTRFGDGTVAGWADRVTALPAGPGARIGAAAHSVRAVPAGALAEFADATAAMTGARASDAAGANERGMPVHAHLSEQRAENDACRARYGRSPTEVLHGAGLLGAGTTVVHATHLSDVDRALLGDTETAVCLCPTTERDLADGLGPARPLADGGSPLCLGSDSHAVIDMFEEARALELDERLRTERRGHFPVPELLTAATVAGHRALGWTDAGIIAPGMRADLVTIALDGAATAGTQPLAGAVFAAGASAVSHVVVDGAVVVSEGRHGSLDVARELRESIAAVTR